MPELSPELVEAEMRRFDELGFERYLNESPYGRPQRYWVLSKQRPEAEPYPAKAIAGNSLGRPKKFHGGYGSGKACTLLESAGFRISDTREEALALGIQSRFQAYFDKTGTTEKERMAKQRVGQDFFRQELIRLRGSRCEVTGITDAELLRASHIVAWGDLDSDDPERLNPENGLLLSALWDAAFDKGLLGFNDEGYVVVSSRMSNSAKAALQLDSACKLNLSAGQIVRLALHRKKFEL